MNECAMNPMESYESYEIRSVHRTLAFFAELVGHRTCHHVQRCFGHVRVRMICTWPRKFGVQELCTLDTRHLLLNILELTRHLCGV